MTTASPSLVSQTSPSMLPPASPDRDFMVYPAIHLRNGQVIRLTQGDERTTTVYSKDPIATAKNWIDQGADWLQVVNLDAAYDEEGKHNWQLIEDMCNLGVHIQVGGGIRTMEDLDWAFRSGISRVMIGTAAIENPMLIAQALAKYGSERIIAAIGADEHGSIRTHGWRTAGHVEALAFGIQMRQLGVTTAIYSNIQRDGSMAGVDFETSARLAKHTGLQVIVSGGVSSLDDIKECYQEPGICGVAIGRALYAGRLNLQEVFAFIDAPDARVQGISLLSSDLPALESFYQTYFNAIVKKRHANQSKIELGGKVHFQVQQRPHLVKLALSEGAMVGVAHIALAVGGRQRLKQLINDLYVAGFEVHKEPHDSRLVYLVKDPDSNVLQLTP